MSVEVTECRPEGVTARHVEIVDLLASGYSRREAGARLGIAEETVKFHLAQLSARIGIGDQAGMVGFFYLKRVFAREPSAACKLWRPNQLGVLRRIALGQSNEEIAAGLGLSVPSVRYEIKLLMRALCAVTRPHLVRRAIDSGALPLVARGGAA